MAEATTAREARVRLGAQVFIGLIEVVSGMTETNFKDSDDVDSSDPRDYKAAANTVRGVMLHNLNHHEDARREGFLRALTDLICIVGDGFGPGEDWDPIATTAASFDAVANTAHSEGRRHG
ncbi:MAG: hypothetical protein QM750_23170 [Rubrivivax sp.]